MNGYRSLLPPAALLAAVAVTVAASLRLAPGKSDLYGWEDELAPGDRRPEAQDKSELYGWEDECGRPASRDKSYIPS